MGARRDFESKLNVVATRDQFADSCMQAIILWGPGLPHRILEGPGHPSQNIGPGPPIPTKYCFKQCMAILP